MIKYLVVVLLLVAAHQDESADDFFLSPPLPPTSFLGQFWTTQFRVLGLDNPVFHFENLPKCFTGYEDGTIEGTPEKAGSFAVEVHFKSGKNSGVRNIVIRVARSVSSTQEVNSKAGVQAVNKFIVVNPKSTLTYSVGDSINLSLEASNGKNPYTWNFLNLPNGLKADKDGNLQGSFEQEGYYSFSASACDESGETADSYFTFNIQPKTLVKSNLIEVPNRNVPVQYNLKQVAAQQKAAVDAVYAAIHEVDENQKITAEKRENLAKAKLALEFATAQENAAQVKTGQALQVRNLAQIAAVKAHEVLENAAKILELTKTNRNNADHVVHEAEEILRQAREKVEYATKFLKEANIAFINAQTETSQAAQNAKAALTAVLNARNVYNLAFDRYTDAKKILQEAQEKKQQADLIVANAKNALNIVNQANDNAQSDLTSAQNVYEKAYSALDNANGLVSKIREQLTDAGDNLGVAKFNLQQALNNLYVAQARKEQADKATSIVRVQSSALPAENSTSSYIFAGCTQQAYPTISGSASVEEANGLGYRLSSGSTLLFGDCTERDVVCAKGDSISYEGYIKNGYVHATSYKVLRRV